MLYSFCIMLEFFVVITGFHFLSKSLKIDLSDSLVCRNLFFEYVQSSQYFLKHWHLTHSKAELFATGQATVVEALLDKAL